MTKKDEIQEKIINKIVENNFRGVILASVRTGKTRILLKSICEQITKEQKIDVLLFSKILVLYPNIDIKKSWENECKKLNLNLNITYCTFASIEKIKEIKFDYIIIDEAHLLGEENQLPIAGELCKCEHIIFASGTYSKNTLLNLKMYSGLDLIVEYTTEQAIKDAIISDYKIFIHKYSLNNIKKIEFGKKKKWFSTEYNECKRLSKKIQTTYGQQQMFHALVRMRFINNCNSLIETVNKWIYNNLNERFILFTGSEEIGKKYNLPMFNSKSKNDSVLQDFISGKINQLCLIRKGSAGITYPNLKTILITAINSNGENLEQMLGRSLLNDTENAEIHIFVSDEEFQLKWLKSALQGINKNKIIEK